MIEDSSKQQTPGTLGEFISQHGPLDAKESASILLPLVKNVCDLHSDGKIHCHICTDNVFIDEMKSVKSGAVESFITIGGIGVDLIPCPPQFHNMPPISLPTDIEAAEQTLTKAGILLDPRQIDFYQLGALLCFMVSGHSISQYLRSCKAKADVPEDVMPVIDRALGLNFRDCFKSGEDFAADLQAIISGEPPIERKTTCIPDSIFDGENLQSTQGMQSGGQLPFERLGHYSIIEQIGCGGMGDVYKAHDEALDRFVAIKVLPSQLARQKDFVKRFHAEATAIARLEHPNVVSIYYSGEDQGHHFFAMQYVEGHSLAELLKERGKLSVDEALPIIKQSLAGIGAAHRMGLVHRDIKPGNILLDSSSRTALITDFGVVKTGMDSTQMTVTGTVMGTADYIAPEQARGGKIDNRADLYAMGALMYQMLSGKLPFEAKSATSMMFQHAYEPVRPLSEVAPEVPDELASIILKLMNKEPQDRYASTDDVLAAINGLNLHAGRPAGSCQTPQSNQASQTSQTSIIHVPQYTLPTMPNDLSSVVAKNGIGRLKNRVKDLVCRHAPQVVESLQNTTQQVDGVVSDYERQRNRLAELSKEADAVAAELKIQAQACHKAAQHAAKQAESASDSAAIRNALDIKQQNEQSAAELSQLAAEQTDQADEIKLQLSKLDAKLAQLRSQRDALNARMNAIGGHANKSDSSNSARKFMVFTASVSLIFLAVIFFWLLLTDIDSSAPTEGPSDPIELRLISQNPIGHWKSVDYIEKIYSFRPDKIQWSANLFLKDLSFYKDGQTSGPWTWENEYLLHPGDKTKANYVIKQIDGSDYLFLEWINGEVIHGEEKPKYYVMKKSIEPSALNLIVPGVGIGGFKLGMSKEDVLKMHGTPKKFYNGGRNYTFDNLPKSYSMLYGEISVGIVDDLVKSVAALGSSCKFANGLRASDPEQKVKDTFGYDYELEHFDFKDFMRYKDIGLVFEIRNDNKTVMEIEVLSKPAIKNSGLVAHWKFDEGSGDVVVDSVGSNDGTIHGATWTEGISGKGIYFNKNGKIEIDNSQGHDSPLNLYNRDVTLSAWIYIPNGCDGGTVISRSKSNYVAYRLSASISGVSINHYDSSMDHWYLTSRNKLKYDTWHHIVGVYQRSTERGYIYIDGVEQISGIIPFNPPSCDATTKIGCRSSTEDRPFQGKVEEVQIYNRALSAKEIQKLYRQVRPVEIQSDDGLIAHWKFDEGSGDIASDSAGNNRGTIHGATWTEGISGKALSFDGIDDYVDCGSDSSLDLTEFTWALWIRRSETAHSNERSLISTNGIGEHTKETYGLQIDTSGNWQNKLQFVSHGTSVYEVMWSQRPVEDTNWHHIVVTRNNSGETVMYIDGIADVHGSSPLRTVYNEFIIGSGVPQYGNFKGAIDDVRVYDRVLSEVEVANLYRSRVSLPPISNNKKIPVIYAEGLAVDGIVIGDKKCTASYIESLLGKPNQIRDRLLKYTDKSIDFVFSGNGPLSEIHLNSGFKGRLDTGISMASTKQQVFEVYGEPLERITDKDLHRKNTEKVLHEKGTTSRIYYGNAGLIFWFRGNSINQIVPFKGKMKSSRVTSSNAVKSIPLTLSDEAIMSLDFVISGTATIANRRDVSGPGVEFDIDFPAGESHLQILSSKLKNIDISQYNYFSLKFTIIEVPRDHPDLASRIIVGAKCNGYSPASIYLAPNKVKYVTSTTPIISNTSSKFGISVDRRPSIKNSPPMRVTIKVEPVDGVYQLPISTKSTKLTIPSINTEEMSENDIIFFVTTRKGTVKISSDGKVLDTINSNSYRDIEILGDKLFLKGSKSLNAYNLNGDKLYEIPQYGIGGITFKVLKDGRLAFGNNVKEQYHFIDHSGKHLSTVTFLPRPDGHGAVLNGIQAGNNFVFLDGNGKIKSINLDTYELSVFKEIPKIRGGSGAIDYHRGVYYIGVGNTLYRFTERTNPDKITTLPARNITGLVVSGNYAYVPVNSANCVYKVNLSNGKYETFISNLESPSDIAMFPVGGIDNGTSISKVIKNSISSVNSTDNTSNDTYPSKEPYFYVPTSRGTIMRISHKGVFDSKIKAQRSVEVIGDKFFVVGRHSRSIEALNHNNQLLFETPTSVVRDWCDFVAIKDGKFALCSNSDDQIHFIDKRGYLLNPIKLKPVADNVLQNLSGIEVNGKLILCEDGDGRIMTVDLKTYELSVFKDMSSIRGSLGAIAHQSGVYYVGQANNLYSFTETTEPVLAASVPKPNITGIEIFGNYAYLAVNGANSVYKVNLKTGKHEVFAANLERPSDIAMVSASATSDTEHLSR